MAKKRIDRKKDVEAGTLTFTEVASNEAHTVDATALFPMYGDFNEVQKQLVLHAINAKVGDSAADPSEPAIPQIAKTAENLTNGVWAERATGEGSVRVTDMAQAIANVMTAAGNEVTEKDVATAMAEWDDDKKKAYKADPRVKSELEKIRAARATARSKEAGKEAKEAELEALSL